MQVNNFNFSKVQSFLNQKLGILIVEHLTFFNTKTLRLPLHTNAHPKKFLKKREDKYLSNSTPLLTYRQTDTCVVVVTIVCV